MSLARQRWKFIKAQHKETWLWLDQGGVPPQVHSAEETISAHLYRRQQQGKAWGRVLVPVVDRIFSLWQRDEHGNVVRDHCFQAYRKEMGRVYMPPEYRETQSA